MAGIDLLNINLSVIYQFVIFMLTLFVLNRWLIKPVTETLALRRERLVPLEEDTGLEQSIAEKEGEYAELLQTVRSSSTQIRQEIRDTATAEERDVIANAQAEAKKRLEVSRSELQASIDTAREELRGDVPKLAKGLAKTILGREL